MKKIVTSILLLLTFQIIVYSQCSDFYRQTPNGTNVKACTDGGFPDWWVDLADQETRAYAISVHEGGNNSYNCHASAWHVLEGGDKVWVNNMDNEANNINNYWNDGSYLEVVNQPASMANVKVFYGSTTSAKDHSAITTTDSNIFISKMGCGVLCSHLKTNSPYDNSSLRYFVRDIEISGTSLLCNSNAITYTSLSFVNCTYNWTYDVNRFDYVSGQGTNNFQIAPKNPLVPGQAWVKLELTINSPINKTREISKDVWVGPPTLNVTGPDYQCPGDDGLQYYASGDGATSYLWEIEDGDIQIIGANNEQMCALYFYPNYLDGELHVTASNECGTVEQYYMMYWDPRCDNNWYYSFSPNPANTTLTVERFTAPETVNRKVLKPTHITKASTKVQKNDNSYTIEIWHEKKGKVKTLESVEKKLEIDVSTLEKGNYFLHIITPTAIYKEQLLIQ